MIICRYYLITIIYDHIDEKLFRLNWLGPLQLTFVLRSKFVISTQVCNQSAFIKDEMVAVYLSVCYWLPQKLHDLLLTDILHNTGWYTQE